MSPSDPSPDLVGTTFADSYEITAKLGEGGSSTVYKARYVPLDQVVALKVLRIDRGSSVELVRRLKSEARNAGRLEHPNIAGVMRINLADNGTPFLVIELADGKPLSEVLAQRGRLSEKEFFRIFDPIMSGLEHAHNQGVVHCDLKPSNIIVACDNDQVIDVKIVDFGISKYIAQHVTGSQSITAGGIIGTPAYMSPEQCRGEKPGRTSDIYSLGCIMYEAVSGRQVFAGENAFEIIQGHLNRLPESLTTSVPPVEVSAIVSNSIMACLQKDFKARPQSISELRSLLRGSGVIPIQTAEPRVRRRTSIFITLLVAGLVAAIGYYSWSQQPDAKSVDVAEDETTVARTAPSTAQGRYLAALDLERTGNANAAFEMWQLANSVADQQQDHILQHKLTRLEVKLQLSQKMLLRKRFDESEDLLLTALQLSKDVSPERQALIFHALSEVAAARGDPVTALERAKIAVGMLDSTKHSPSLGDAELRKNRVTTLRNAGYRCEDMQQFDEAEKYLREALALDELSPKPEDRLAGLLILTEHYTRVGRHDKANETALEYLNHSEEQAASDEPDEVAHVWHLYGNGLSILGKNEEADRAYKKSIELSRRTKKSVLNLAVRLYSRACNLYQMGRTVEADQVYKECEENYAVMPKGDRPRVEISLQQRRAQTSALRAQGLQSR